MTFTFYISLNLIKSIWLILLILSNNLAGISHLDVLPGPSKFWKPDPNPSKFLKLDPDSDLSTGSNLILNNRFGSGRIQFRNRNPVFNCLQIELISTFCQANLYYKSRKLDRFALIAQVTAPTPPLHYKMGYYWVSQKLPQICTASALV